MIKKKIQRVVLAYSGGLDTSVILRWLEEHYQCEVIAFTADLGQAGEIEQARDKARALGIKQIFVEDLKETFVRDFVFPLFRANTIYEGEYLLGTAIARPLIAQRMVQIAKEVDADAVAHGATGKGNDQVRFELGVYALNPNLQVIAPWREWDLTSRESLIAYANQHNISIDKKPEERSPYSMDANLLHISYEGEILEDPWIEPDKSMWRWTTDIEDCPDTPEYVVLRFSKGDCVAVDNTDMSPAVLLTYLNDIASRHGIGRCDIVENRYVGIRSRGCYETPGGTLLQKAHRAMESITLDRDLAHLKDDLMPKYARMVYNGYWWSPERIALQALIDTSQQYVEGEVKLKLYKGGVWVVGRRSERSLFDAKIATFGDDEGAYNQKDAEGFINLNALRLKAWSMHNNR